MAVNLEDTLVIGVSSTALFDLKEQNDRFRAAYNADHETAIEDYRKTMREQESEPLTAGVAYQLVKALLTINAHSKGDSEARLVEVVILSRNSPETGRRVLNAVESHGLDITRFSFRAGKSVIPLLEAYNVDLFLTTSEEDAQKAIDKDICAAGVVVQEGPTDFENTKDSENALEIRIAFDGDAVLFSNESEAVFQVEGLDTFQQKEAESKDIPMKSGPYTSLLHKLMALQNKLPSKLELSPLRVILITARNAPAHLRALNTLRAWEIYVDEAHFLGGLQKGPFLHALKPHIFFDDQKRHFKHAAAAVPCVHVPIKRGSSLDNVKSVSDNEHRLSKLQV